MVSRRSICLSVAAAWVSANAVRGAQPPNPRYVPRVASQQFDVSYELETGSSPVELIELWYTMDVGQTWRRFGQAPGAARSIAFNAGDEGLFGFFVVANDAAGASSPPPDGVTEPQFWAFVDYTPPVVQLHAIEQRMPASIPPVVVVRWSAIDTQLPTRPIELSYRTAAGSAWTSVAGELANSGSYDWRVPESVDGHVTIRVTVRDRGGHVVEDTSEAVTIVYPDPSAPLARAADEIVARLASGGSTATDSGQTRGYQLFQKGLKHAARGENRLAISRLKDALSVEPGMTEALVELGRALYAEGDLQRSIEAYNLALAQRPGSRDVLEGLASAFIGQRQFGDAVQQLSRIVQSNPKDADAWLNLGDIAIYQGDELLAREHYERAMTSDPEATEAIKKAELRLSDVHRLAREFRQIER